MALPAFYHSREVKELGAEAVKINNSRTIGILLAPECIYAVFCTGSALMKWEYRTELKVKALLSYHASRGILSGSGGGPRYHPDTPVKALLIGEGMDTALKMMESTGGFQKSYFYLDSSFDYFHYIPDDTAGITLLRLLCSPALQKALRELLLSDLQAPCPDYGLEHDAVSDGLPLLLAFDFDILTLSADAEVETPESREDTIWHELQNAYRTRKILTGTLGGIEKMEGGGTIAVVYYKEMRVVIPLAEMMINLVEDAAHDYGELVQRQNKILGNMLGCEIDFIIKGLDNASRSVVASRKDAMYKKRQIFYLPDANGNSRVCEDRIVQARVIAVAEKVVRVEIFGTECSILARDLSWDWMGDATERFHVGEQILVRILSVKLHSLEDISVKADVKSVNGNTSKENLSKCKIQGKYAGTVTDIHKGTVFVRLHIGVNAVAHSCYDNRLPGKKDEVSFVVTRIDSDRNVAVGLISRIIKQNI